jgi:hypothetical protein
MLSTTPSIGSLLLVRLFRLWAAARAEGENPLPHMQQSVWLQGSAPELTVACSSLFDLVEAHLGRPLVPECCCSTALSRDEQALRGVLRHAPEAGQPLTSTAVPHGLPGAICWAAFAVRRALGERSGPLFSAAAPVVPAACPFGPPPRPFLAQAERAGATAGTN